MSPSELACPAMVFAPHPDDETLGCGGTIIRKLAAGAEVKVVFLTDGRTSHARVMPPERMGPIRTAEARAAMEALGVPPGDLYFLELPARRLAENMCAASERVAKLLDRYGAAQVFVPYCRETNEDHLAANRIVLSAVRRCKAAVTVYEYPVWFWNGWPWVKLPLGGRRQIPARLTSNVLRSLRLLMDFRCRVYVGDVLDRKRAALDCYASQMTRLPTVRGRAGLRPDDRWATLGEVGGGEFLRCFFREYELFRRYVCIGRGR
jgi:LmbE family N-acetylglucosaminyl deacetylase